MSQTFAASPEFHPSLGEQTASLPGASAIPAGVDVDMIIADVADDGVSAPASVVDDLVGVVDRAESDGIALSIVVIDRDPPQDSQLRDLATDVGSVEGGTVLVLSPGQVGSFSDGISRVVLEAGQDLTYTGNAVVAANNFVDEISEPGMPWTAYTVGLLIIVAAVIAALAALGARRGRTSTNR